MFFLLIVDNERFAMMRDEVQNEARGQNGIGTLGEKTLHAVLKKYVEPNTESQEARVGRFVADVVGENGVVEIQTRNFQTLVRKLEAFLPHFPVTVVYPAAALKYLQWIDPDTGELSQRRQSPKKMKLIDCCYELYKIKDYLTHPDLQVAVYFLEVEEYKQLNGFGKDRKIRATRYERVPTKLLDIQLLACPDDYRRMLPEGLPEPFTTKELAKAAKIHPSTATRAARMLYDIGILDRIGKRGRAFEYVVLPEMEA